jgi:hypothetical protein
MELALEYKYVIVAIVAVSQALKKFVKWEPKWTVLGVTILVGIIDIAVKGRPENILEYITVLGLVIVFYDYLVEPVLEKYNLKKYFKHEEDATNKEY